MQRILKDLLSLTAKSEASQWQAVEQQLLKSFTDMNQDEYVDIVHHFGTNQQGSLQLWNKFDSALPHFSNGLTQDQSVQLLVGFGESGQLRKEYDEEVSQNLMEILARLGQQQVNEGLRKDPYFLKNKIQEFNEALPSCLQINTEPKCEQQEDLSKFWSFFSLKPINQQSEEQYQAQDYETIQNEKALLEELEQVADKLKEQDSSIDFLDVIRQK